MLNSTLGYSGAKIKYAYVNSTLLIFRGLTMSNNIVLSLLFQTDKEANTIQRTSLVVPDIGFPDYVRFKPRTPPQENQNGIAGNAGTAHNAGNADDAEEG
jgi:hypothetical protein